MNSGRRIVSDTSPLISLEKIDEGYAFIRQLYDQQVFENVKAAVDEDA